VTCKAGAEARLLSAKYPRPHPEVRAAAMRQHRPAASLEGRTSDMQGMKAFVTASPPPTFPLASALLPR